MIKIKNFTDGIIKILLIALVALVFLVTTVAFGNAVLGVLASAFYVYEVAQI